MPFVYLNQNSTSAAAANWSDGIGVTAGAELVAGNNTGVSVSSNLDFSAVSGIESFEIQSTFEGDFGKAGTPFVVDADFSADAFIKHGGTRKFYYDAGGGDANCNFFYQIGSGASYIEGGTIDELRISKGGFYANESTVITNVEIWGGSGTFDNNATGFTSYTQNGGQFTVKRDGTFVINSGTLVLDIPDTSPTISLTIGQGARVIVLQANTIATVYNDGILDISRTRRPVTLGASNHEEGPYASLLRGSLNHTISTPSYPAGRYNDDDLAVGGI